MEHAKSAKGFCLEGHRERVTDVAFSPVHNHLATASADRTARLWSTDGSILKTFEGHLDRLARIAFHPSGKYLGTTSFDKTWRLWDIGTGEELLLQEGHSKSVNGLAFHHDGSWQILADLMHRHMFGTSVQGEVFLL
ncbi:hypothetical protein Ddye_001359 [Dipteronia dyeriana]|uniref:Uncharacterized protein n=1 Tax=Dipteronia dyeriana TaxID=168575 RepID=A0AAE0CTA5_9ROSI|nr:hypothetical protein Ddye_001359 [Dipteronia dyeriana]